MIGIYKITSPSGKVYIGQSVNIEKRFKAYKYLNKVKNQKRLFNSLNKYGYGNHNFEILIECTTDDLNKLERHYQDLYNVLGEKGLNSILIESDSLRRVFYKCKITEERQLLIITKTINILKSKGLFRSWLAKILNVSNANLSRYLSGKTMLPDDIEFKLIDFIKKN